MGILDRLPDIIANALGPAVFSDGYLIPRGERTSDGQGGFRTTPGDPVSCKLLVTDYSDYRRLAVGIPATDRKIIILAATLADDVEPAPGLAVTAEGRDWQIVAVARDPAAATWELQVR